MAEMIVSPLRSVKPILRVRSDYLPWSGFVGSSPCRSRIDFSGQCTASKSKTVFGRADSDRGKTLVAVLVLTIGALLVGATMMTGGKD